MLNLARLLTLQIWDIASESIHHKFREHRKEVCSLAFSSDGRLVVSGSADQTAKIWNVADWKTRDYVDGSSKTLETSNKVRTVTISSDGRLVAAGDSGGVREIIIVCLDVFPIQFL